MKLSTAKKKTLFRALPGHHVEPSGTLLGHQDSVPEPQAPLFLEHVAKAAGFTRKDFEYGMKVSKTLVKAWFEGERHDPLTRARDMVSMFRKEGKAWLIPLILVWIAGGDDFDGRVFSGEEHALLCQVGTMLLNGGRR